MFSRILALAIAAAVSFTAFAAAGQNLNLTQTCAYQDGPRAGQTVDYAGAPGAATAQVGDRCADMHDSRGVAIAPLSGRAQTNRFYASPGAPSDWKADGQLKPGLTLTCFYTKGPLAGNAADFSGVLGAQPVPIGWPCADGASEGFGAASRTVSPGPD